MKLKDPTLGSLDLSLNYPHHGLSVVDVFIERGWSDDFERELTDLELDYLNEKYSAEIQEEAWTSGRCLNHN
jgi:hypothetical protein